MNSVVRTRRKAAAVFMTATALVLAGCGGSGDSDKVSAAGQEEEPQEVEFQAAANLVGLVDLDHGVELAAHEAAEENALLAPTLDLQITELGQSPVISAAAYEEITGDAPGENEDEEPIEQVHAADGHVFHVAKFINSDPGWELGGDNPQVEVNLYVGSDETERVFRTSDGTAQQGTIIVSLPVDADAEAATLRHTTQDKNQVLSVVTGERVSSEVAQIYESVTKSIEMTSSDSINESFPAWAGGEDYVQGSVVGASLANFLQPKGGGNGWAGTGKHYVVVDLEWRKVSASSFDESTIHVELENGDVIYPARNVLSLSSSAIAFEIPVETENFKVVIETDIKVGGGANAPRHSWDPLVSEFVIS